MKKLILLLMVILFAGCDKSENGSSVTQVQKKKPAPTSPAPCGRVTPDPILTSVNAAVYSNQMQLSFDPLTNVSNYILYYQQTQPSGVTNGVTIDGLWYRQASSGYTTLPITVTFGWSPMYLNATYTCRVGIYYNGGCYSYSAPFTVNTTL